MNHITAYSWGIFVVTAIPHPSEPAHATIVYKVPLSDGIVPYESSHIDFSVSEKLVPSSHPAHRHPLAIDEVKRILLLHLKQRKRD